MGTLKIGDFGEVGDFGEAVDITKYPLKSAARKSRYKY